MPNWCSNTIRLTHDDTDMIERVVNSKKNFLEEFIPCPFSVSENDKWYDWRIENWGTKWDVDLDDVYVIEGKTVYATFCSAWCPPIEAYRKLEEMGFKVLAFYYESGMSFAGRYENGNDEYVSEVDFSNDDWDADLPMDLVEYLQPEYANWQQWQEEDAA